MEGVRGAVIRGISATLSITPTFVETRAAGQCLLCYVSVTDSWERTRLDGAVSLNRQDYADRSAAAQLALGFDSPAVKLRDVFDDR
jgi:hypothetical protein